MSAYLRRYFLLVVCMVFVLPFTTRGEKAAEEEWVDVEVLINLLDGADASNIDEAIKKANEALAKAKIRLVKKAVDADAKADGDGSGDLDLDERDKARKDGVKELKDTLGAGKGLKIDITDDCDANDANAVGLAIHRHPVIIIEPDADPNELGKTIAHEFGHVLTLDYDLYDTNDVNSLMYGYTGSGTELDANEIEEIHREAKKRGKAYKKGAAVLPNDDTSVPSGRNQSMDAHGAILDEFGDMTFLDPTGLILDPEDPSIQYADIGEVIMFTDNPFDPASDIRLSIQLGPEPPDLWPIDSFLNVTFDGGTGLIGGIQVAMQDFNVLEAIWFDFAGNTVPIDAVVHRESEFSNEPEGHGEVPHSRVIEVTMPVEIVSLPLISAQPVFVQMQLEHADFRYGPDLLQLVQIVDQTEPFIFGLEPPCQCPGLTFSGGTRDPDANCGDTIDCYRWFVSGCGFTPGRAVQVELNGDTVNEATVDEAGNLIISNIGSSGLDGVSQEVIVREVEDDLAEGGAVWASGFFVHCPNGPVVGDLDGDCDNDFGDLAASALHWLEGK
jgi:hypothetical protein